MAKAKTVFICSSCGANAPKWVGKCPSCDEWNTYVEEVIQMTSGTKNQGSWKTGPNIIKPAERPKLITDIQGRSFKRIISVNAEWDRVMGGGIVPGSVTLVGGQPGIGKSTLMLQLALALPQLTLYVSGEESEEQIKMHADRLGLQQSQCYIYCETDVTQVLRQAMELKPALIVLDSIQTMHLDMLDSSAGSISQIRESAAEFQRFAKEFNVAVIIIGHITKDGDLAGPKLLEHIVDTVLYFEGDRNFAYRILRSRKNRFGSTDEIGVFEMSGAGLREIADPGAILAGQREESYSGNVLGVIGEGSRTFLIEVQALVARAVYGTPQRSATGYDSRRMNMLLAVLEKRCNLPLGYHDVFLNIAGGLRVDDPGIDLSLAMAVMSSLENKPVSHKFCFVGEVGLSGEIRPVQKIDQKVKEAARLGMDTIFISKYARYHSEGKSGIEVIQLVNVEELLELLN